MQQYLDINCLENRLNGQIILIFGKENALLLNALVDNPTLTYGFDQGSTH